MNFDFFFQFPLSSFHFQDFDQTLESSPKDSSFHFILVFSDIQILVVAFKYSSLRLQARVRHDCCVDICHVRVCVCLLTFFPSISAFSLTFCLFPQVFRLVRDGNCFGEMSFALQTVSGYVAEAVQKSIVLEVQHESLHNMISDNPMLGRLSLHPSSLASDSITSFSSLSPTASPLFSTSPSLLSSPLHVPVPLQLCMVIDMRGLCCEI